MDYRVTDYRTMPMDVQLIRLYDNASFVYDRLSTPSNFKALERIIVEQEATPASMDRGP